MPEFHTLSGDHANGVRAAVVTLADYRPDPETPSDRVVVFHAGQATVYASPEALQNAVLEAHDLTRAGLARIVDNATADLKAAARAQAVQTDLDLARTRAQGYAAGRLAEAEHQASQRQALDRVNRCRVDRRDAALLLVVAVMLVIGAWL